MKNNISVIGLGKLGGSMAACFAYRGFNVVGVDIDDRVVDAFNNSMAPFQETGLDKMIASNKERLRATTSTDDAILNTDISFVIVPTPTDDRGAFSLKYASAAFKDIGKAIQKKKGYHVVVMTSTVLPGSMRHNLIPILENESFKKCGKDFGVCYNPEFIALGSVINDFLNPDFYLLGQYDSKSGDMLEQVHRHVSMNNAPVKRMNLDSAVLYKISVNSFVTIKISFANMLAEFCERIPGANVDVVSDALGMDERIGRKYLTGGFGYGGPCFPRDNVALDFMGKYLSVDTSLIHANDKYNRNLSKRQIRNFKEYLPKGAKVTVLGLSYKPLTNVIEESSGIELCNTLINEGYKVTGHDYLAVTNARKILNPKINLTNSLDKALMNSDVVIVTTTDVKYKDLTIDQIAKDRVLTTVIDIWRILPSMMDDPRIKYVPIGICRNDNLASSKISQLWK